jgi:flagellar basal-body rod protein FlgG
VVKSESDPEESRTTATRHDEIRKLCRLNLANRSTPGYKSRELMIFEQTDASAAETPGPAASNFLIKVTQGNLTETQRVLDCAIRGPGFFKVKRDDETLLTRCGRFVVDHEGRIALPRSHGSPCPLEPAITVPENCERLRIDVIGKVTAVVNGETQSLGSIALFNVFDPTAIQPAGDNLFKTTPASGFATPLPAMEVDAIIQGSIEESNVDPAVERRKLDVLTDSPL